MSRSSHQTHQTSAPATFQPAPTVPRGLTARSNGPLFRSPTSSWVGGLGPALGTETKVLTFRGAAPVKVCVVLLADRGPADPGLQQRLICQAQFPSLRPVLPPPPNHPHCGGSRKVTVPPDGLVSCPQETHVTSTDTQPQHAARTNLGPKLTSLL